MKAIIIGVLALITLGLSVVFLPWCELGFGLDRKEDVTTKSMLAGPLNAFVDATEPLKNLGEQLRNQVVGHLNEEAKLNGATPDPDWSKPVKSGNYAYVYFMSFALVAAAIAIIVIGREDAEEITVLPVKK